MARPWRIQFPDAVYHVICRGNNRQPIFFGDPDRELFLDLLGHAVERFNLHLFAFCLMPNHYHLFLRTPQPNLAGAMHWLNATFTGRMNRRHHRLGHLFQGRYKAVLVADESHWLHLSIYLHLNPVRAGLVEDPGDYRWSSFPEFIRPRPRFAWLQPGEVLAGYGHSDQQRRLCYRRECLGLMGRAPQFWENWRRAAFLGSPKKWKEFARRHPPLGQAATVPDFRRAKRDEVDPEVELARVAKKFGVDKSSLFQRRPNHWARMAAYYHLVEHCGVKVTRVAARMGVTPGAISLGVAALQERMRKNSALRAKVGALTKN